MALLPVILNMVDDLYGNLDRSQRFGGDIPLLFVPNTREHMQYRHPNAIQKLPQKSDDEFYSTINVQSFKPDEISVKVKGHEVIVEGKHEEREDEHGFVSRQFTRRYVLPEEYDMETVATFLDADGKLIVKAQKPKKIEGPRERVIPIERVASVVVEDKKKTQQNGVAEENKKDQPEYKLEDVME